MSKSNPVCELAVSMFGVVPGGFTVLLTDILNQNQGSTEKLASMLATTDGFKALYPDTMTAEEKALKMALAYGLDKNNNANGKIAYNFFLRSLNDKVDIGSLFNAANQFLLTTTDTSWSEAKKLLENRVNVAIFDSQTIQNTSTDLVELIKPLSKVFSTTVLNSPLDYFKEIYNSTAQPTLSLSVSAADEGASVVVTLSNVLPGTLLTSSVTGLGITSSDYIIGPSTGMVGGTGVASFMLDLLADKITEGSETATITVNGLSQALVIADKSVSSSVVVPQPETVVITSNGSKIDGGTTVNTTYNISAGTYTYSITGFGSGDKFVPFAGAAVTVLPDIDNADGTQSIQFADAATSAITTITLVGLTGAQDNGLYNLPSINAVFGAGTIA